MAATHSMSDTIAATKPLDVRSLFSRLIDGPDPIFLLGAGASVSSGIPASGDLVRLGARWLYAKRQGWLPDDPRIRPGDISTVLESEHWYRADRDWADMFPDLIRLLDSPREFRRRFLLSLLKQTAPPNVGYQCLASLLRRRIIHSVLTTNFDDLIRTAYGPGSLITIGKQEEYVAITTAPAYPQVIYLHGQAEYYKDRNLPGETESLDELLVARLLPMLRDHPLVVVGYRGSERSVMHDLLFQNVQSVDRFKHGVYWCSRRPSSGLAPMVSDLADALGRNFNSVAITDFDALLTELRECWRSSGTEGAQGYTYPTGAPLTFDLRLPTSPVRAPDTLPIEMTDYAERFSSDSTERDAAFNLLATAGLAVRDGDATNLTNAGVLLLEKDPRVVARGAWVEIRLPGKPPTALDGTLWTQFESAMSVISDVNPPVRMKGQRSKTVRRYSRDAIKEVLANALVHRSYESPDPIVIRVETNQISIESPGGIEPSLLRRLLGEDYDESESRIPPDLLQRRIARGERGPGITGYRNPVIADLWFGNGLIDKAGSGLSDALASMEAIDGQLLVEVSVQNTAFTARLIPRQAAVDSRTSTARPSDLQVRAHTNLFEVIELPRTLFAMPTTLRDRRDLPTRERAACPPFVPHEGQLFALVNPALFPALYVGPLDGPNVTLLDMRDFQDRTDGKNIITELLNETLLTVLRRQGLRVDWKRRRAYFPCTKGPVRRIKYQARVHQPSRRVAWWPGATRTYCIHKAAEFHFEHISGYWCLRIAPTYVFTLDGDRDRIRGREATSLATSNSTEDYNQKALADVFFWRSILEPEENEIRLTLTGDNPIVIRARPLAADMPQDGINVDEPRIKT